MNYETAISEQQNIVIWRELLHLTSWDVSMLEEPIQEHLFCQKKFQSPFSLYEDAETHTSRGLESTIIHFPNITVWLLEFLCQLPVKFEGKGNDK